MRGYTIYKSTLNELDLKKLRNELTIQPFEKQRYLVEKFGTLPPKFKIYLESPKKFYIPRFYGLNNFGAADYKLLDPKTVNLDFNGKLRSDQSKIIEEFLPTFHVQRGGILNLKTGGGKTALALYIASKLKLKCFVIVHKSFLVDQWTERIQQFLPNAKIGKIQGKTINTTDADIVIGMLQSISMKEYDNSTFDEFGLTIFDEVHHVAANVFSKALLKVSSKFLLGLSATVERKDGCEKVLTYCLGPIFSPKTETNFGVVNFQTVNFEDSDFQQTFHNLRGNVNLPKMISRMCESPKRTHLIVDLIQQKLNDDRHILVLSERLFQIETIQKLLLAKNIENGKAVGGILYDKLVENCKKRVILATYSYVSEGFDVDTLDTLIYASPKTDIVQSVGRILRKVPEERKNVPLIVDIIDQHMIPKYKQRLKYYKKCNFSGI